MKKYFIFITIIFFIFLVLSVSIFFIDQPNLRNFNPTLSEKLSSISILLTLAIAVIGFPSGYSIYQSLVKSSRRALLKAILTSYYSGSSTVKEDGIGYTFEVKYEKNSDGDIKDNAAGLAIRLKNEGSAAAGNFLLSFMIKEGHPFEVSFFNDTTPEKLESWEKYDYHFEDELIVPGQFFKFRSHEGLYLGLYWRKPELPDSPEFEAKIVISGDGIEKTETPIKIVMKEGRDKVSQ